MKEKLYSVHLTREEIILLDGKCSDKVQAVVNKAKDALKFNIGDSILEDKLLESLKNGKFTWCSEYINFCSLCDKKSGYAKYKSGYRKGQDNHNKPFSYSGVSINPGFIRIRGYGDMCRDCFEPRKKIMIDYILDNDLPIEIQKNDYRATKYKFDQAKQCYSCKQVMYESQMIRRITLMGDGTYPAGCPHCKKESLMFGESHKILHKEFRHIPV